jgi:hypothetical protein
MWFWSLDMGNKEYKKNKDSRNEFRETIEKIKIF